MDVRGQHIVIIAEATIPDNTELLCLKVKYARKQLDC